MIIVEGPDGAGKTTLLRTLQEDLQIEIAPRVVSKDAEAMVDLQKWVVDNLKQGFQHTLYDRHRLISEPIYGPVLRDEPEPGFSDPMWFDEMMFRMYHRVKPVIIYCLPPFERVWMNVMSDDDNKIFHAHGDKLKQIYFAYFNKAITDHVLHHNLVWIYDYTSRHANDKYKVLLRHLLFRLHPEENA